MKKRILTQSVVALLIFSLAEATVFADTSLSRLQELEKTNQFTEAYSLAKQLAPKNSGTPDFDYLYGVAALKTNHPGEALFAFERVLLLRPNDEAAGFELAQSNFQLKDTNNAKKNFAEFLSRNPHSKLSLEAEQYLQKINLIEKHLRTHVIGFMRTESGFDSNVNVAPQATFLTLPDSQPLILVPSSRAVPSWFTNLVAGVAWYHTVNEQETVYFNVSGFQRFNYAHWASRFNFGQARSTLGIIIKKGAWRFNFPMEFDELSFGQSVFVNTYSNGSKFLVRLEII